MDRGLHDPDGRASAQLALLDARFSPRGLWIKRVRRIILTSFFRSSGFLLLSGKRLCDVALACAALIMLCPVVTGVVLLLGLSGIPVFCSEQRVGRWAVAFAMIGFNTDHKYGSLMTRLGLHRLPALLNVLRGEMSIIGPRAVRCDEMDLRERAARKRSSVRPGIISLWWVRKRANIDFGSELDVDLEYIDRQSLSGDFGIALRAVPSALFGSSAATAPAQVDVLGVKVDNFTMEEALQFILDSAAGESPRQICFVNSDCINKSVHDQDYARRLCESDLTLADGIGIRLAGKISRREIRQNVNGTDLFPLLCQRLQDTDSGFFFLGARPEVVEQFAAWVRNNFRGVTVSGYRNGYFDPSEEEAVLAEIRASGAKILLVAFGAPRQDLWIGKHLNNLGCVRVAMGVGGLFDFYSGRIPRAPQWMRELSFEWLWRLYQEPRRMWRRYLIGNVVFLSRAVLATLFRQSEPRPISPG